jgi:hypothetical protein
MGLAFAQDEVDEVDGSVDTVNTADNSVTDDAYTVDNSINDNDVAAHIDKPKKSSKSSKTEKSKKSGKAAESGGEETSASLLPEKSSDKSVKVRGLVAAGVDINRKISSGKGTVTTDRNRVGKGELEVSVQPVKKVRAEFGIEYNINGRAMVADTVRMYLTPIDRFEGTYAVSDVELVKGLGLGPFVTIDKLYGQYNIVSNGAIRAGIMKKSFGHEERAGLDERYFLKRTIVNDGLESLGFLDHDLTASYRHDFLNDMLRLTGGFSWSIADSLAWLQNYSAQYRTMNGMEFVLAGVVRHSADTTGGSAPPPSFAVALSSRYDAGFAVCEAELTVGARDTAVAVAAAKPETRTATLSGARVQLQFPIEINSKILRRAVPVAEAAVYAADLDSGAVDTQLRAGVTLCFAKNSAFQFRNNFGTVIRTAGGKSKARRYRFDSEAIVVF